MKLILFDAVCNLCEHSVKFIIKHDKDKTLFFLSQQDKKAKALFKKYNLKNIESLVLIKDNKAYLKSKALFEIAKELDKGLRYVAIFSFLPTFFTDFLYDIVARNRYKIFGKKESCMVPSREILERFL